MCPLSAIRLIEVIGQALLILCLSGRLHLHNNPGRTILAGSFADF